MISTHRLAANARRVFQTCAGKALRSLPIVVALICGLLASAPLWGAGIVNTRGGGDSPFLLQRTAAIAENLANGIFPPRWMAHAAYDLGYPFFNHYAALPYYLSGSLTLLGLDSLLAIQTIQTLGFVLAALAMMLWARRIYRAPAAQMLTTIAYTFAPFHLVNVYIRGDSLSEFYAFIWYPLILWALDRVAQKPSRRRVFVAALTYGGLILTHNVSALIFSPFALLWSLVAVIRRGDGGRRRQEGLSAVNEVAAENNTISNKGVPAAALAPKPLRWRVVAIIATFILGFLLTAWFWLPAIAETQYVQMGPEFTAEYFHYSNHFRSANLVQPTPFFNYSVATSLEAISPFSMGLTQAALTVIGMGAIALSLHHGLHREHGAPQAATALTLIASLGIATFMITPLSRLLWDGLPLLEITQFPWRFLSVQALFTAAVTGAIGERHRFGPADSQRQALRECARNGLAVGGAALLIIAAMIRLHPERLRITPADVSHENMLLYESFTGNIGTTIRYEYLPEAVVPRLYISEAVIDGMGSPVADGGLPLKAELISRQPNRQVWRVSLANGPQTVAFPLNWWPEWRATVDGTPAECAPMPGSGRAAVVLPPGEHQVTLRLHPTPLRRAASWVSATTAMICILTGAWRLIPNRAVTNGVGYHRREGGDAQTGWGSTRSRSVTVLSWIALAAVVSLAAPWLIRRAQEHTLGATGSTATLFDFEQMPYPHRGPVSFGDAELATVALEGPVPPAGQSDAIQTAHPGAPVTVDLTWSHLPATPLTATLAIVSPAEPRHGTDYTLHEVTTPIAATTHVTLTLPRELPRGLYLLRLTVDGPTAPLTPRTPIGRAMGELYIGAVRIPTGPTLPADAAAIADYRDLTLHSVEVHQEMPTDLTADMAWSTSGTPRNWRLSIRLLDRTGTLIRHHDQSPVQVDHQPGYGYLPTTLWHPGEVVWDRAHLPLPEGLAPGSYTLRIITYLQATEEGGGEHDIPIELTLPTLYDIEAPCPEQLHRQFCEEPRTILCQTPDIALLNVGLPGSITEGDDLTLQAEWNAVRAPREDLIAHWLVVQPDGTVVAEAEQPLAQGSRTSTWPQFTWVLSSVPLDLPNELAAGRHTIELTLSDPHGSVQACGTVADLKVAPRPRVFEAPDLPTAQTATFSDTLRLLGYETVMDRPSQTLNLTLWWQALAAPTLDLKRFVHLYDPTTESIVAQDDAMPRDWQYPTSWWAVGEIVSETISLTTADAPAGDYRLGVGWYDPDTAIRLPARTAEGIPAPANRITLDQPVTLPHRR